MRSTSGYTSPSEVKIPKQTVTDTDATLTVKTMTTQSEGTRLEQTIIVKANSIELAFNHQGPFDYVNPNPFPLKDCTDVPGTLFLRGTVPPVGHTGFVAQQSLNYTDPTKPGRVTIDFWTDALITAVQTRITTSLVQQALGALGRESWIVPDTVVNEY